MGVMGSHLYKVLFFLEMLTEFYGHYALIAYFKVRRQKIAGVLLPQHFGASFACDPLVIAAGAERVLHFLEIVIIAYRNRLRPYRITSADSDFVAKQPVLKCSKFLV